MEQSAPGASQDHPSEPSKSSRPQRVLACVQCSQRKVKCNRQNPCSNCVKARVSCVPATLVPRQRRRRFPERMLLDRLRKYEDLLHQNNINFDPLHKDSATERQHFNADSGNESDDQLPDAGDPDLSTPSTTVKSERGPESKSIWHAMSQGFRDPGNDSDSSHDDVRETAVRKAWDQTIEHDDRLLFGPRGEHVDLSTSHPNPAQIFRLWQLYLDNVDPLLKVTHTPSLQGRIVEAVSNIACISANLEALMFGIYCTSILSLSEVNCQTTFGSSKEALLTRYQLTCQQALWNCGFLRTSDRDCLTALYLYLLSVRPSTVPQSLSSMLGIAIRIAQNIGIHDERFLTKCSIVEAEMRRRLWWSLMLFDHRIGEVAHSNSQTLNPTWDCAIPLNVNDSDLRPEMKTPPESRGKTSEALFAVVRSEIAEFLRHTAFHLDFTNPSMKPIAKKAQGSAAPGSSDLDRLEQLIEGKYLKYCDEETPIHFMTIWSTRAYIAKCRLMEHHARFSSSSGRRTNMDHDAATLQAIKVLECDTRIMTSRLTKGFLWLHHCYFPFPAYIQVTQDLRKRPTMSQFQQAWEAMSDNYDVWFPSQFSNSSPFYQIFSKIILQAWEACEEASGQPQEGLTPPRIVSSIKRVMEPSEPQVQNVGLPNDPAAMGMDELRMQMPMTMGFANQGLPYSMGMHDFYAVMRQGMFSSTPGGQAPFDGLLNQMDWTLPGGPSGWRV